MKLFAKLGLITAGLTLSLAAMADPVGTWRTIDDATGKPKSLVKITVEDGKYVGRIVQLLNNPSGNVCNACEGKLKGQNIAGKTILWGVQSEGGNKYGGGKIMDPKNDKTYTVSLTDNGNTLAVRGSVMGIGRTQTWYRQ